jgi:ABC-type bacteriocin/lantibiotic exporter with double-glycine peptidase domain
MPGNGLSSAEARVSPDARHRARGPSWGCAENCLKEILLRQGVRTGIGEVAELVNAPGEGASFADLARAAKAKGLKAVPRQLSVEELDQALLAGEGPCVVHLSWGGGHFSVAEVAAGSVQLVDPPDRVWQGGSERLRQAFSGHALFFEPAETAPRAKKVAKKKATKKKKK